MFLFCCCRRVDCGCQNEPETEASRSSHSSHDYLRPYEKQIQCRLLPQPIDISSTKHFTDYSGCSHTSTSRSLLAGSTQSIDYEEVLLVSVSPGKHGDELIYADVSDSVICKPPCSSGIASDQFLPDASTSNNNLLPSDTNSNVKLVQDGGSEASSDVSSASSIVDDENMAEVRYVADIRQFQPTQTSIRAHGEECCCPACQSVRDLLVHHSSNHQCSCKSCRDFYSKMQYVNINNGFTATTGDDAFSNQYRLMSGIAQDGENIPLMSAGSQVPEGARSYSQNVYSAHDDASVSTGDYASEAVASEVVDDDNELISSDDELRYVFHKFIDDGCLEEPFTLSPDDRLQLNAAPSTAMQLESNAVQEYTSARSADDLEVAYFMVGSVTSGSPSTAVPDGAFVTASIPALTAVSVEHQITVSEDIATSVAELTVLSLNVVTEPSTFYGHENLSEQYTLNIVCSDVESGNSASTFEMNAGSGSGSPGELENLSGALRIEDGEMKTDISIDSDLNVLDNENQEAYSESPSNEVRREVIVQKLSDNSSFFIEFPAANDEHVSDVPCSSDISTPTHMDDTSVGQECSPGEDNIVVGQCLEILTPECITEHPVSIDEVQHSSRSSDDVSYVHDEHFVDVASYIRDIVANAVQQIADDGGSASVRICSVASENISSEWPKQILITNAAMEDEYGGEVDNLPSTAALDTDMQLASEIGGYCTVGTADVTVFDTDICHSSSSEAIYITGVEAQDVPQVENYLISYDVHQSQQPMDDGVDQTLVQLSDSASVDNTVADDDLDDIKLEDLVRPLEHVPSEDEQSQAGSIVTFPPADIVEDFFRHYVLPVDSVGLCMETAAAAAVHAEQYEHVGDVLEVDQVAKAKDVVEAKQLESATQNDVISTSATEADIFMHTEATATSALPGVPCIVWLDLDRDKEDETVKQLATTAETFVDVVISDAVAETYAEMHLDLTADEKSVTTASDDGDALLVLPTRSSCLLQSPSDPHRKKSVHFADMHGLQLETVQHYHQSPEPDEPPASLEDFLSKLSAAAAERRAKWTEHHPSRVGSWFCSSSVYLLASFELPSSPEELLERVQRHRVALESCSFDDLALAISGVVRVANIAFHKTIVVRYTVDQWMTHTDIDGDYIPRSNDGPTDRFSFTIILPSRKQFVVGSEVEFAIRYVASDGPSFEFWDSNQGRNYVVRCCSKAASSDDTNVCDDDTE